MNWDTLKTLAQDESAPTTVEYAIMASLIAAVIVGAVGVLGRAVLDLFTRVTW